MLLTTIWMLAADHNREAKDLQKRFNLVETQTLEWRKTEQTTSTFEQKTKDLDAELAAERAKAPPPEPVDEFVKIADSKKADNGYDVASVENAYKALAGSQANADERTKLRDNLLTAMQNVVNRAIFIENEAQRRLKFKKADLDVDLSMLAIEID
jgi:hypothetical protein